MGGSLDTGTRGTQGFRPVLRKPALRAERQRSLFAPEGPTSVAQGGSSVSHTRPTHASYRCRGSSGHAVPTSAYPRHQCRAEESERMRTVLAVIAFALAAGVAAARQPVAPPPPAPLPP